ncbi:hypothetical protein TPR58_19145 [Sphingomonas sp. HF-S3]|uniref:DUF3617 family protein n=1 Tax=Sphingomonas rustica TaxID=3103142 RepID=A0ABV0BCM2_9SPHN
MTVRKTGFAALAGLAVLAGVGAGGAYAQQRSGLTALNGIEGGQWVFREGGREVQKMCLRNPAALIQINHPGAQCNQVVLENGKDSAAVHYTCPSHGWGRTSITVETSKLVVVTTAGVRDGSPFSNELEGRKVGSCG